MPFVLCTCLFVCHVLSTWSFAGIPLHPIVLPLGWLFHPLFHSNIHTTWHMIGVQELLERLFWIRATLSVSFVSRKYPSATSSFWSSISLSFEPLESKDPLSEWGYLCQLLHVPTSSSMEKNAKTEKKSRWLTELLALSNAIFQDVPKKSLSVAEHK